MVITSLVAVIGVWISHLVLPLSLSLLTGGVLLALPYLTQTAFRRTIVLSLAIVLLVGVIYIFNEPAQTPFVFFVRVSIFISCLLIVLLMSYLVYRSSAWMHSVVREVRDANTALRSVQAGLEETIQKRTFELTQSNEQLMHEIGERRRIETRLREQNAFLETLYDTSLGIVHRLEMKELLHSILKQAAQLIHIEDAFLDLINSSAQTTQSFAALGIFEVDQPHEFTRGEGLVGTVWDVGRTVVVDDYEKWERRSRNAVAENLHAVVGVPLVVNGSVFGVIGMARQTPGHLFTRQEVDLLERFASLASLACDNAQLYEAVLANEQALEARVESRSRELTAALKENEALRMKEVQVATAEERSRLARDLHDSVSQAIYGIVLGGRTMQHLLVDGKGVDTRAISVLDYIINLAGAALTEMRALIFELRPESLQMEGVLAAIRKQCEVLHVRYGLKIDLQMCEEEPDVPIELKEAIYRIMLEATHNVVKHAGATQITIRFQHVDDHFHLQIIDNGNGFDSDAVAPGRLGLQTMQERASKFNGQLQLVTAPGRGTEVCVDFSLATASPA